ncbi:cleavage and polyadenylation specificity factor subunit 4-like [Lineus longissimus]|uniref:cleavage and polyadenylation specificity factor subunit 4-like n=1 Tax=Lineus longissimus TaxID=88925 RepID=UPI00315C8635
MQEIIANVDNIVFDIEYALEQQLGAQPLPFPGMDKSGSAICSFFLRGLCARGGACPFRHVKGDRSVVCKHWLRGLCKKGDDCEFLHEYDMSKMPECYFYSKFGLCSNKDCPFLHIDPESKIKNCPWYDRGFCRHGPLCKNRHSRRVICPNYLSGFCLEGKECKFVHPSFDLPGPDPVSQAKKMNIICHNCGESGHKATFCQKAPTTSHPIQVMGAGQPHNHPQANNEQSPTPAKPFYQPRGMAPTFRQQSPGFISGPRRPLDQVTCYKCNEKGHYANKCPRGHLAFLHSQTPTS